METKKINDLYQKYLAGTLNATERKQWGNLLADVRAEGAIQTSMDADYENLTEGQLFNLTGNRGQEILVEVLAHPRVKKRSLWIRYAVAAAGVAAVVFGLLFLFAPPHPEQGSGSSNYANDIAPGGNAAILRLASGKTITLSDGKTGVIIEAGSLKYNDGSGIQTSSVDSLRLQEELTITIPRGGTYQVRLPDGTNVWLNAASSLTYVAPSKGSGSRRMVKLSGEAYFEVFKNKNRPFIVNSKNQEIIVLGTHFNVSAYDDENSIKTTLLEGSVKVSSLREGTGGRSPAEVILKPSQQAINTGTAINVNEVEALDVISWKNGKFIFNNEDITTIMKKIARWYDVEVVYEDNVSAIKVTGGISRFQNVSKILEMLETTGGIHFKIEGKKVTVRK